MNTRETRLNYVRIHQSKAEHDAGCPYSQAVLDGKSGVMRHFRVTRPLAYPANTPGHMNLEAREGHYTHGCCATCAATIVRTRLTGTLSKLSELDVQVWP